MSVRYSVVVPTHRRPDTLRVTLKCLAAIAHPRLEVVVMDNAGGPETAAVIQAAAAGMALKATRSDVALAMSDSWEMGLAAATGDYVTVIGDDDALAYHTIAVADQILEQTRADILGWSPCVYYWPTATNPDLRDIFRFSMGLGCTIAHPHLFMNEYMSNPWVYHSMPGIYQSFVSKDIVQETKRKFGRYFIDRIPDISSAITNSFEVAHANRTLAWTQCPLSIWGMSHNSVGQRYLNHRDGQDKRDQFRAIEDSPEDPRIADIFPDSPILELVMASIRPERGGEPGLDQRAARPSRHRRHLRRHAVPAQRRTDPCLRETPA